MFVCSSVLAHQTILAHQMALTHLSLPLAPPRQIECNSAQVEIVTATVLTQYFLTSHQFT